MSPVNEYKKMIKTIFQESNETYGVDRICGELRKRGKTAFSKLSEKVLTSQDIKTNRYTNHRTEYDTPLAVDLF
jgi:repressor of nif and glnA expression